MRLTQFYCLFIAVGMLALSPALSNADIVEVGGNISEQANDIGFDFNGGGLSGAIDSADADFTGTGAVFTGTGLTLSTGEVFDFTATVTHNAQVSNVAASTGGRLGDDAANDDNGVAERFGNGDLINIAVAVTSGDVVFDGFVNFGTDLHANNEGVGFEIDGVTYLRGVDTNGDNDPRFGINIPGGIIASDNVDILFIDPRVPADVEGIALRGFALQFSAQTVPEPASATLLLVGMGVTFLRRRK